MVRSNVRKPMAPIWRLASVKATVIASDGPLVREGGIIMRLTTCGRKRRVCRDFVEFAAHHILDFCQLP